MLLKKVEIDDVLDELLAGRTDVVAAAITPRPLLDIIHGNFRQSARNLLHYLSLRRHDLRPLQRRLAAMGLSSLGRAEPQVLATLDAVVDVLHRLSHRPWAPPHDPEAVMFDDGRRLLEMHTTDLLGPECRRRSVRIMVTMPSEAAVDYQLVHDLVEQGMDCMRINCAHDDAAAWQGMINNLRKAEKELRRSCRVVKDLAGPKLRTGPIEPGPAVLKVRPHRDLYGRVT